MIYLQKKVNRKKGFTLIEMLIAVFIFTVSLVSLMTMSSRGLKSARNAEKQVIADYLAIEAIEVVRNLRDESFLKNFGGSTWQTVFQGGDIFSDEGCFDDGTGGTVNSCNFYLTADSAVINSCTSCRVFMNPDNFYYYQTQNDAIPGYPSIESQFQRKITIREISPGQIMVFVRVLWEEGEVVYNENLFLWQ